MSQPNVPSSTHSIAMANKRAVSRCCGNKPYRARWLDLARGFKSCPRRCESTARRDLRRGLGGYGDLLYSEFALGAALGQDRMKWKQSFHFMRESCSRLQG